MTSRDLDNCILDNAANRKAVGYVRIWVEGHAATQKWIVIGQDLRLEDHIGFREISEIHKSAVNSRMDVIWRRVKRSLSDHHPSSSFHTDIELPIGIVEAL